MFFLGLLSKILPAWAWLSNKIWWTYAARQHCLRKNVLDTVTNASTAVSFPKRETVFTLTIVKKSWHMLRFSYPIYSTVPFNLFKIPCLHACNLFCSQLHESTVMWRRWVLTYHIWLWYGSPQTVPWYIKILIYVEQTH